MAAIRGGSEDSKAAPMDTEESVALATPTSEVLNVLGIVREKSAASSSSSLPDQVQLGWPREINTQLLFSVEVEVMKDKLTAKYTGRANHAHDVGSVQANEQVPTDISMYYYEISVVDSGYNGAITVGFADAEFPLNRQVGTRHLSWGFRGDEAKKYAGSTRGTAYGQSFKAGDIVGCGINFYTNEIFYTKNGRSLGTAFKNVTLPLFPVVSLHSPGVVVRFNFGQQPFAFDIEAMRAEERAKIESNIISTPLDPTIFTPIIRQYLAHYGHFETLKAFEASCGVGEAESLPLSAPASSKPTKPEDSDSDKDSADEDEEKAKAEADVQMTASASSSQTRRRAAIPIDYDDVSKRKEIRGFILRGDIAGARKAIEQLCPGLLERNKLVRFHLDCREFAEMFTRERMGGTRPSNDQMINHVRVSLTPYRYQNDIPRDVFTDTVALWAYLDPYNSPLAYLLQDDYRNEVADVVNVAILAERKQPPQSTLELLMRQLLTAHETLRQLNIRKAGVGSK